MSSPFTNTSTTPGEGTIHLSLLQPSTSNLRTLKYQYPLKLVSPAPIPLPHHPHTIHTVYILTYGGGLVAGDTTSLNITLDATTRLVLLTQGTTKLFRAPSNSLITSHQTMSAHVAADAMLCYLPDPVQPFAASRYTQTQIYTVAKTGSLCVLDWVCNGRVANGEDWDCAVYGSRSEVWGEGSAGTVLLVRDSLVLEEDQVRLGRIAARMETMAVFGTIIVYGPLVARIAAFFIKEFQLSPRVGAMRWDDDEETDEGEGIDSSARRRLERHKMETEQGVLWSAASMRGCVIVKFGAPKLESARRWLYNMLCDEGSIVEHFGERALLCLR